MIPLKLHIKNFMSYGIPQDIDFEPYNLMCLSGKNGHGKSALLDALTWVLWGHARKASATAKADEGLVHLGKTHMLVILDFMSNGTFYRVKREHTLASSKGQSNLEFGILNAGADSYKALTDKTIRATQAKITQAIGLDFDAFVNSAFLRQGQSHEFSKKSPKDRKEILASILGLEHFERVRKLALDNAKLALTEKEQAEAILKRLEEELKEKDFVKERLKSIEEALAIVVEKEQELQAEYSRYKKSSAQAQSLHMEAERMRFQKEQLAKALDEELHFIGQQIHQWRSIARKQRQENIQDYDQKRFTVQKELQDLQIRAAQKVKLKEEYLIKNEALRAHKQKIEDTFVHEMSALEKKLHAVNHSLLSSQEKCEELSAQSAVKAKEVKIYSESLSQEKELPSIDAIASKEQKLEQRKGFYHTFISRAQTLQKTLEEVAQKKHLIETSEQAVCPLCEQKTDKNRLTQKLSQEEHLRRHQLNRLRTVCTSLKTALTQEHASLELLKKNREEHQVRFAQHIEREKQHKKTLTEIDQLSQALDTVHTTLAQLDAQKKLILQEQEKLRAAHQEKSQDDVIEKLTADVKKLTTELHQIVIDPEQEKKLTETLSLLTEKSHIHGAFMKDVALQQERKKNIYQKCERVRELKRQLTDLKPVAAQSLSSEQLAQQEELLGASLSQLTKEKEGLIHQKGALEAQEAALKQKEFEYKQQVTSVKAHTKTQEEYTAIATAFSKDGIQALLIEDALPEIEEEANNLLSRLTENQAHISIDSLKDTKSGKIKETLDIKISDAAGVRPYEMFSGGEAFRIDFSLRVALSKLLARRAGATLQTLIIDEGFGSQDDDGLAYIMQALHSIQDEFAKIIVVSHLPALKDQFPVHFQIQKTPQGSQVSPIEHC